MLHRKKQPHFPAIKLPMSFSVGLDHTQLLLSDMRMGLRGQACRLQAYFSNCMHSGGSATQLEDIRIKASILPWRMVALRVCSAESEPSWSNKLQSRASILFTTSNNDFRKGRALASIYCESLLLALALESPASGSSPKTSSMGQYSSSSCQKLLCQSIEATTILTFSAYPHAFCAVPSWMLLVSIGNAKITWMIPLDVSMQCRGKAKRLPSSRSASTAQ